MADRWHQAEDLYHAALERPANQRAAFLLEATGGDDALRQEVESLLSRQSEAESFIGSPASEISNREPGPERGISARASDPLWSKRLPVSDGRPWSWPG